jgi:hypothetical protein
MVNILESRKTFVCYSALWFVFYIIVRAILHFVYNFEPSNLTDNPGLFFLQVMGAVLLTNHFTHKSYPFVYGKDD